MRAALLFALLLAACGDGLSDPTVLSVTPSTMLASEALPVTVQVEGVLPFQIDYGRSSATADVEATVLIDTREFPTPGYQVDGTVVAFLPSVLSPGLHDVSVRFGDGRSGVATGAFTVLPGQWPGSYEITTIPDQVAGQPFLVTVRAVVAAGTATDTSFGGTVNLSTDRATPVTPSITQPFDQGLVTERTVVIAQPAPNISLVITDGNGTTATSNAFRVDPP